jgi:hypothetical protein
VKEIEQVQEIGQGRIQILGLSTRGKGKEGKGRGIFKVFAIGIAYSKS